MMAIYNINPVCPVCNGRTTNYEHLRYGPFVVGVRGLTCNKCKLNVVAHG